MHACQSAVLAGNTPLTGGGPDEAEASAHPSCSFVSLRLSIQPQLLLLADCSASSMQRSMMSESRWARDSCTSGYSYAGALGSAAALAMGSSGAGGSDAASSTARLRR